jgi:hypothetical protein
VSRSATAIILGAELHAWRHRLLKRSAVQLVLLTVFLGIAAVFIGGGAFAVGATAGQYLPAARDSILAGGFTGLSVLMLVVGFPTVIASFFVGRDLLQLVLAPVRPLEIFLARLVLAMSANILISAILLMATLGVGLGSGAPPVYFALATVLVFIQVLLITAVQAMLMSLVLRWIPARLARDVAAAVAGLSGAGFYVAWNLNLRQSFSIRSHPDLANLTSAVHSIEWLPSAWPGHALSGVIIGDYGAAATWSMFSLVLAALVMGAAAILYERTLLAGLGVFGGPQALWRRASSKRPAAVARRGVGSPTRAIARKDWLSYRRDIRRLSRLIPAFLFPIGYGLTFFRPGRSVAGFWTEVFLVAFISMFVSSALATPAIPSERRGFQLLRMAPMTMWQVIRAKVTLTLPPVLALTLLGRHGRRRRDRPAGRDGGPGHLARCRLRVDRGLGGRHRPALRGCRRPARGRSARHLRRGWRPAWICAPHHWGLRGLCFRCRRRSRNRAPGTATVNPDTRGLDVGHGPCPGVRRRRDRGHDAVVRELAPARLRGRHLLVERVLDQLGRESSTGFDSQAHDGVADRAAPAGESPVLGGRGHEGASLARSDRFERAPERPGLDLDDDQLPAAAAHQVELAAPGEKSRADDLVAARPEEVGRRLFAGAA